MQRRRHQVEHVHKRVIQRRSDDEAVEERGEEEQRDGGRGRGEAGLDEENRGEEDESQDAGAFSPTRC